MRVAARPGRAAIRLVGTRAPAVTAIPLAQDGGFGHPLLVPGRHELQPAGQPPRHLLIAIPEQAKAITKIQKSREFGISEG